MITHNRFIISCLMRLTYDMPTTHGGYFFESGSHMLVGALIQLSYIQIAFDQEDYTYK